MPCLRYLVCNFHQLLQVLLHILCVYILSTTTFSFSRPFSCTFSYIHAYIHLWTHSDVSILHLHSSVDVQRSLQCYSYIFAAIFVYIFVHPRLHPRGPSLALFSRWQRVHGYTSLIRPRLHSLYILYILHSTLQRPITCLVFKVAKSAWLHFTHQTGTSLFSAFSIYIKRIFS